MKTICRIHLVHYYGSRKSAIKGTHMVIKLINWDLTYPKGVFKPSKILDKKFLSRKTFLKKNLIYSDDAFLRKDELKNIFLRIPIIWICIMYYRLMTTCFKDRNRGEIMKFIILSHNLGLSIKSIRVSKN